MIVERKFKTKEVVVVPTYTINLSEYEAATLFALVGNTNGSSLTKLFKGLEAYFGEDITMTKISFPETFDLKSIVSQEAFNKFKGES